MEDSLLDSENVGKVMISNRYIYISICVYIYSICVYIYTCVYVYIYIICIYQLDFRDTYPPFWTKRDKPIARLVAEDVELDPRSFDMIIRLCNRQGWLRWETLWLGWLRWMGQLGPGKM